MIDLNALQEQCPECKGKGGIENTTWYHNWAMRNSKSQILETKELDESVFFFCRNCHGTGKLLTDEGKRLMEFVRFWMNPNY